MKILWINKTVCLVLLTCLSLPAYALKPVDTAIIELYQRIENLQHDVNSLRGLNEQLQKEMDRLRKNQKEGLIDMDDRIQAIEANSKKKPPIKKSSSISRSTSSTSSTTKKVIPVTSSVSSKVAYRQAYALLKDDPAAAVAAFERFLNTYKKSPLAANAHYWIGETWYSKGQYQKAKEEFLTVLKQYKGSSKEPHAALKLGYTFVAAKEWNYAKKTLQDVIKFFPGTHTADLAKKKLATIKNK